MANEITISFYNELQYSYSVPSHFLREGPFNSQLKYRRQVAYLSAILEFDLSKIPAKVKKVFSSIEERLKLTIISGGPEYQPIQDAKSGMTVLRASIPKIAFIW